MPNNFYNRKNASVNLDGQLVRDIAEGNAIRINPAEEGSSTTNGLDGGVLSIGSNPTGTFEIDVLPSSSTMKRIYAKWRAQQQGFSIPFACEVTTGVGRIHSLQTCAIKAVGKISTGGDDIEMQTVVLDVANINLDEN